MLLQFVCSIPPEIQLFLKRRVAAQPHNLFSLLGYAYRRMSFSVGAYSVLDPSPQPVGFIAFVMVRVRQRSFGRRAVFDSFGRVPES